MMKKYLTVVFILFLIIPSLGCIDQPEPPGSELPRVVVDYQEEVNETIIYLSGMEIERFDNLSIEFNETKITEENAYSLEERTNLTEFDLIVEATREEQRYHFNATFNVKPNIKDEEEKDEPIFRVTYYDGEEELIYRDDLPYIELLDEVGEET